MTDFLAEVEAANNAHRAPGCSVGAVLRSLPAKMRPDVEEALYNRPELSHAAIHSALKAHVKDAPSAFTIGRHRRGICSCER